MRSPISQSDWDAVTDAVLQLELSVSVLLAKAVDTEPLSPLVGAVQRLGVAVEQGRAAMPGAASDSRCISEAP